MAASDQFLLLDPKNCLPSQHITVLLGRVCENPNRPVADYFPQDPTPFYRSSAAPFEVVSRSTSLVFGNSITSVARIHLDELLSLERQKSMSETANWTSEFARVFTLPQEREVLRNLLGDPQLKARADKWLDGGGSLYMVTGFVTLVSASCKIGDWEASDLGFKADISKALDKAILALGGVPVALPDLAAELRKQSGKSAEWSATYAGENIVAVRYRKLRRGEITFRWDLDIPGVGDRMFGANDDGKCQRCRRG
jgi:hypothetical protein